ncbi:MAG: hypothetical protein JJE46_01310 [Acidimicrobiia bacterium]|nr:hypothetical protein [Acidimicrobiia bacterium]
MALARGRHPVVIRVTEPGNWQTRVATVNGAVVHQCRIDSRILDGQLVLALG